MAEEQRGKHKVTKSEYHRNYYLEHSDKLRARSSRRYYDNKDEINAKIREKKSRNRDQVRDQKNEWYADNLERERKKAREYYAKNRDRILERERKKRAENREEYNAKVRERDSHRREKINNAHRIWRQKNREEFNARVRHRSKTDIMFALNRRMSCNIRQSLKRGKHGRSWESVVGYSAKELKSHIKRQFTDGMSWEKYLSGEIHIDHIVPISAFKFESVDDIQFKACWDLNNLRPMWAKDNLIKNYRLEQPFQQYLF